MNDDIVIQSPPKATALFLLFHGVGATPQDLVPLGTRLARDFPQAAIVSVPGPDQSDLGRGLQWFSVIGVTEQDRPQRVAATLDRFVATVHAWQRRTGIAAAGTTLIGFSQGAIMALASTQAAQPPAARVVSLSGRFSELPSVAPAGVRIHFLHGDADPVIPAANAQQAARQLQALGARVTLDVLPGLGHGVNATTADLLVRRLREP
jgi:phospholipase/carboxylesterase